MFPTNGPWSTRLVEPSWRHRLPSALVLGALILLALTIIFTRGKFDSEILNLLPSSNPAVEGLKIYNSEFAQNRELAFFFALPDDPEGLETFRTYFLEELAAEPWVTRFLAAPPMESPDAMGGLSGFLAPVLLSLPPAEFSNVLEQLQSGPLTDRLAGLTNRLRAGSPMAALEMEADPLGLQGPALGALASSISMENTFALSSEDGTAQVVSVITTQDQFDADSCGRMMQQVQAFIERVEADYGPEAPSILVTGRSAYVDQIRNAMQRDLFLSSAVSIGGISILFFLAFRSLLPLLGITTILATGSLLSLALGCLLLPQLNLIALAFCSILFGLGNDFGLLLQQFYLKYRKEGLAPLQAAASAVQSKLFSIACVATTTALGFSALTFSGSEGFAQLGLLTAMGIVLCGLLMPLFFFLFTPRGPAPKPPGDRLFNALRNAIVSHPGKLAGGMAFLLATLTLIALIPWRPITFDTRPSSLEPANIPAAQALQAIMHSFPATFEPAMVVLTGPDLRDQSSRLEAMLVTLQEEGIVSGYSVPTVLLPDLGNIETNREALIARIDPASLRQEMELACLQLGINPESLHSGWNLIDLMISSGPGGPRWRESLPEDSPWWFLIDRLVSPEGTASLAYLNAGILSAATENRLLTAVPEARISGWSQTLTDLVPWAEKELLFFAISVSSVILIVLALVYRSLSLWLLHAGSLFLAMAAAAATFKLLDLPLNLLNVLALPLILGVGVDYSTHLLLGLKNQTKNSHPAEVFKPVLMAGLTTMLGFGALILARNPALASLGLACLIGVGWNLAVALLLVLPCCCLIKSREKA